MGSVWEFLKKGTLRDPSDYGDILRNSKKSNEGGILVDEHKGYAELMGGGLQRGNTFLGMFEGDSSFDKKSVRERKEVTTIC